MWNIRTWVRIKSCQPWPDLRFSEQTDVAGGTTTLQLGTDVEDLDSGDFPDVTSSDVEDDVNLRGRVLIILSQAYWVLKTLTLVISRMWHHQMLKMKSICEEEFWSSCPRRTGYWCWRPWLWWFPGCDIIRCWRWRQFVRKSSDRPVPWVW